MERFNRGEFDLVAVGRAHLADAEWVNKVREGRYDDITGYEPRLLVEIAESWTDGAAESSHTADTADTPAAVA